LLGKFQSLLVLNAMFADYPLVIYDDLPINSMVIFHGYVTNNQMVNLCKSQLLLVKSPCLLVKLPSNHS